ncbi:PTS lactose/cellobiose transporter subunit IIA [Salibacterium aidingense]|uniref:PTS lactose/cellobiose transporter subunit IIA n=1 Tax=Salibacterium aidingense TaxID=384933 RepID=UPI0003F877EB|nr:PTS lactose/cellobiose transporter subunit IIA [Salibacterium aidingense]
MEMDISSFMPLITEAGQSKNCAFEALACAKVLDREGYDAKMKKAQSFLLHAHKKQTEVLNLNAREQETPLTVYLVHAMDHVSNAKMVYDLVQELAEIHLNRVGGNG